eukprot:5208722-Prymnesium_polylepis.1
MRLSPEFRRRADARLAQHSTLPWELLLMNAELPCLKIIFGHLWPNVTALAGVNKTTREVATAVVQRCYTPLISPVAFPMLQASWLLIHSALAAPRIFVVGGYQLKNGSPFGSPTSPSEMVTSCSVERMGLSSAWHSCSAPPQARHEEFTMAFCDGFLFVGNDWDHHGDPTSRIDRYNLARDKWERCAPLPQCIQDGPQVTLGALATHNGKVYHSGGDLYAELPDYDDDDDAEPEKIVLGAVSCYDLLADVWSVLPHEHAPRCNHTMLSYRGQLWVAGGRESRPFVERTNSAGVWVSADDGFVCSAHGYDYLLIAFDTLLAYNDLKGELQRFDYVSGEWFEVRTRTGGRQSYAPGRHGVASTAMSGKELIIVGENSISVVGLSHENLCIYSSTVAEHKIALVKRQWCQACSTPSVPFLHM